MDAAIKIHPGVSKWDIRQKVWDYMEAKNLANFPRPVHNRIPNFKGAERACAHVSTLEIFHRTNEVKVDPDKPLEGARLEVLQAGKTLLVPTPRLRTGLLNKIVPPQGASRKDLRVCSTSQGVREYSVPIGLDAKITVDLVVVGAVAVSEKGYRIGKGEGYSDMEYAMMVSVGAVKDPVVVSVVHDCQVIDIPENLIESHDLTVDYILTPTRAVRTRCTHPKPQGIIWAKLDRDVLEKIPILKKLRSMEERAGKDVTLGGVSAGRAAGGAARGAQDRGAQDRGAQDRGESEDGTGGVQDRGESEDGTGGAQDRGESEDSTGGAQDRGESEDSTGGVQDRGESEDSTGGAQDRGESEDSTGGAQDRGESEDTRGPQQQGSTTLYLGLPPGLRVSELKSALRGRGASPLRLSWQGAQRRAFLDYSHARAAADALRALEGLSISGKSVRVQLARSRRAGRAPNHARTTRAQTGAQTPRSVT
ncbi:methenyltetrahydrofolate synthase domain-containing protein [Conger conger]|uniref:methenyltetrahydrofolate synthase domain-containing protein n=1 Tax=Conger conger TaxID=82655 RepID=UPI002A5AAA8E|nr:methenyltetrahydrofolate synthase domain-containing protein [Conger conger]